MLNFDQATKGKDRKMAHELEIRDGKAQMFSVRETH